MLNRMSTPLCLGVILGLLFGLAACVPLSVSIPADTGSRALGPTAAPPTSVPASPIPTVPVPTQVPPTVTAASPVVTAPLPTLIAPTRPPIILPTSTMVRVATARPTPVPPPTVVRVPTARPTAVPPPPTALRPATTTVKIFLIAIEDGGRSGAPVGCGDSVIGVNVTVPQTQAVLTAALTHLLSLHQPYYGESGLYTALHQSNLQIANIGIQNGTATIALTGSLVLGGVCDNPRVQAQIEQTARQFSTVSNVVVTVNGVSLASLLSGQ